MIYLFQWSLRNRKKEQESVFVIFGMGRVGSTHLINLLNQNPAIHCDSEILDRHVWHIPSLLYSRQKIFKEKKYGFRIKHFHATREQGLTNTEFLTQLESFDLKWIYIQRIDLRRVALSACIARFSGVYNRKSVDAQCVEKVNVSIVDLRREVENRVSEKKREQHFLSSIELFHHVVYERDLEDLEKSNLSMKSIFEKLGVENVTLEIQFKKLANQYKDKIENYSEVVHFLEERANG